MSRETFEILVGANLKPVRNFVQMRLRIVDQTDDVLQQTLMQAFLRRHQLRAESKFKSWLFSIAINQIRTLRRSGRRDVSLEELPNRQFADRMPSPFSICERTEGEQRLQAGLARLTNRDRTAIRLVDIEGMTQAQAARELAISEVAFKSTHYRARRRLGEALRRMSSTSRTWPGQRLAA
jgi:RNA polymerase sigma-70 factor, ECF subfamily